jgi:hypothetical protein
MGCPLSTKIDSIPENKTNMTRSGILATCMPTPKEVSNNNWTKESTRCIVRGWTSSL